MFYNVSETVDLQNKISELVGPVGRMLENPDYMDVVLWCAEHGKIWYGDLSKQDIQKISKSINMRLYVIHEWYIDHQAINWQDFSILTIN